MEIPDKFQIANNIKDRDIDPDPFSIAFAILGLIFAGGSYLEIRRQREFLERQAKEDYRKAWFHTKRTLIHSRRVIEEFATYVTEDDFGNTEFLFGKVKLTTSIERARELRRLHTQTLITATHLADSIDDISFYLASEYSSEVDKILDKLKEQGLPHSYDAVILLARDALELYEELIAKVGGEEGFSPNDTNPSVYSN